MCSQDAFQAAGFHLPVCSVTDLKLPVYLVFCRPQQLYNWHTAAVRQADAHSDFTLTESADLKISCIIFKQFSSELQILDYLPGFVAFCLLQQLCNLHPAAAGQAHAHFSFISRHGIFMHDAQTIQSRAAGSI